MRSLDNNNRLNEERRKTGSEKSSLESSVPVAMPLNQVQRSKQNPSGLSTSDVLLLQRQIGNRAVADMLGRTRSEPSTGQPHVERSTTTLDTPAKVNSVPEVQRKVTLASPVKNTSKATSLIQLAPEWAIVKKREGRNRRSNVATHKFRQTRTGVEVRSGGMFGTGVEDRLREGHEVSVDLAKLDRTGRFAFVTYDTGIGGTGAHKEAYINKDNVEFVKNLPQREEVRSTNTKRVKKLPESDTLEELGATDVNVATGVGVEDRHRVISLEKQRLMQYREKDGDKRYYSASPAKYQDSIEKNGLKTSYGGSSGGSVTAEQNVGRYNSKGHIYMFTYKKGAEVYGRLNVGVPYLVVEFVLSRDHILTVDPESGDVSPAARTAQDIPAESITGIERVEKGKGPKGL